MTPLATKALLGIGSLAVVSGGSILAWQKGVFSSSPKNIKEKLISEGYQILDFSSNDWAKIFEKYKSDENKWKFKNGEITSNSPDTDVQKLKDKCNVALEGDPNDKNEYYKVAKWCTIPRKVESFISASSLLNTEGDDASDKSRWQEILSDFKATKTGDSGSVSYAMSGITINSPENNSQDAANITAIKGGCKTRRDKFHYELDFEKTLEEVNKWCTRG